MTTWWQGGGLVNANKAGECSAAPSAGLSRPLLCGLSLPVGLGKPPLLGPQFSWMRWVGTQRLLSASLWPRLCRATSQEAGEKRLRAWGVSEGAYGASCPTPPGAGTCRPLDSILAHRM